MKRYLILILSLTILSSFTVFAKGKGHSKGKSHHSSKHAKVDGKKGKHCEKSAKKEHGESRVSSDQEHGTESIRGKGFHSKKADFRGKGPHAKGKSVAKCKKRGKALGHSKVKGNNGLGNGVDPAPPGDPKVNDSTGTPGNPDNKK